MAAPAARYDAATPGRVTAPVQADRFPRLATEDEHERDDDLGHDFRGHVLQHVQDEFVHARVYAS